MIEEFAKWITQPSLIFFPVLHATINGWRGVHIGVVGWSNPFWIPLFYFIE